MVSTFTNNLGIEEPGSGDYVGTWDAHVNSNMTVFDTAFGTAQNISLGAGSVSLSVTQARSANLIFTGALIGNTNVIVSNISSQPSSGANVTLSGRTFTVQNQATNSSLYTVTILTTYAGAQSICVPPYDPTDIVVDSTASPNPGAVKFRNLGRVGTFWDYAGSSVPNWVSGCTIPPYLLCDGSTFAAATYPALNNLIGGTLPDSRGRFRATLNQTTGRITSGSSTGGVDGNTNFASGGSQTTTLSSQNVPLVPITDPGHTHQISSGSKFITNQTSVATISISAGTALFGSSVTASAVTGITAGSTGPTNFSAIPPAYVAGITLIRSA